ncbi:unnamed protein product [Rotaria sp. Silwood2]|nr:unnamed protein product [Rotaria sp. Silwood2]
MERKRKIVSTTDIELDQTTKKQKKLTNESGNTRLHSGKYTLDSDEEDDEEQDNAKTMNLNLSIKVSMAFDLKNYEAALKLQSLKTKF